MFLRKMGGGGGGGGGVADAPYYITQILNTRLGSDI